MKRRVLVVNADDFGLASGVNRGVARAFEPGVVTSTSLMVRAAAAVDAGRYARSQPELAVGLHVDLGEWSYRDGDWVPEYQVVDIEDERAVSCEIAAQLARFTELTGRRPTHLDSHQHVHGAEPVRSVLVRAATSLGIPLRGCDERIAHRGDFYGQDGRGESYPELVSVVAFDRILETLPEGWTELGCHPGEVDDLPEGMYREERELELAVLGNARARDLVVRHGVELASFADLPTR
jgi:chitin disaccharide deacetylase